MNLLLIDLSSIAHAQFHMSGSEPDPDWTAKRTVARVHALASGMPSGVAVAIDSPPYFRKDIDPAYKANRTKEHAATVGHQIAIAIDALKADGFPVWGVKGYEADDIIATAIHKHLLADEGPMLIASADKDLLQLVSDRVSIKSLKDGSIIGPDEVKAKFSVWPHQMVDYLSLVGDTSDNVPGAKGIGAKRAAELLELFGSLDDCLKVLSESDLITGSMFKSLTEFQPRLATVRSLIRLRTDAPIPFEDIFKERVPVAIDGDMAFASDRDDEPVYAERIMPQPLNLPVDYDPAIHGQSVVSVPLVEFKKQYEKPAETLRDVLGAALARGRTMTDERESGVQAEGQPETAPTTSNTTTVGDQERERIADVVADAGHSGVGHHEGITSSTSGPAGEGVDRTAKQASLGNAEFADAQRIVNADASKRADTMLVKQAVVVDQLAPLPDDWRHQLEPRSYRQLKDASADIAASRHYANLGSPSGVLATIAAGRELGMHMMASLRAFHIIEGKPAMSADLIRAIVIQSPLCEYFRIVERTPTQATWKTKRKGDEEVSLTYTIEQGRQAWQKDQKAWDASSWGKRPINMVTKTASSELCRLIYPDVVMNLYSVEELGGEDVTNG